MRIILAALVALALAGGAWYLFTPHSIGTPTTAAVADSSASTTSSYTVPPLTKSYANSAYGFSLNMPGDFAAQDISDPTSSSLPAGQAGTTIVLQNQTGDGIQIIISPWSEDTSGSYTLTADRIHQDLPDLQITDEQPVDVGPNYTGLAFESDNQAFGGSSREVWFVYHGNLYQISTYERLDPLLKAIFGTWNFN